MKTDNCFLILGDKFLFLNHFFIFLFFVILCYFVIINFYKNYVIIIILFNFFFFHENYFYFFMFRDVPACPGFYRRPCLCSIIAIRTATTKFCTHDLSKSQKTRHFLRGCHAYCTRLRKVTKATNLISDLYLPKETHPQFLQSE